MIEKIERQIVNFKNDISYFEKQNAGKYINDFLLIIKEKIIENTKKYFEIDNYELQETLKKDLIMYYNLLYYYQAKVNGLERAYLLDDCLRKLPNIYMVDQNPERFEINNRLLHDINFEDGLTMEQALELLKWSANNTRDNLIFEGEQSTGMPEDVYGNSCLDGACGFSQFSTLYPLQQAGLEVTINNVRDVSGGSHAYGTVIIPIRVEDKIVKKRFLLDCTYRQFFTLPFNVVARYLSHSPFPGFFIYQDEGQIKFAKELLRNGFIEANLENMERYLKPFCYSCIPVDSITKVEKKFKELDIFEILEKKQTDFDYTEDEFIQWGFNLNFMIEKRHL